MMQRFRALSTAFSLSISITTRSTPVTSPTRKADTTRFTLWSINSCNPTPALGFNNAERSTLELRSKADCVLALAVIHHLSIASNIPLDHSADYFADRADELVIEFVGPGDNQVKRILAPKNISYDWYTEQNFQRAFSKRFKLEWRQQIPGTDRALFRLTTLK